MPIRRERARSRRTGVRSERTDTKRAKNVSNVGRSLRRAAGNPQPQRQQVDRSAPRRGLVGGLGGDLARAGDDIPAGNTGPTGANLFASAAVSGAPDIRMPAFGGLLGLTDGIQDASDEDLVLLHAILNALEEFNTEGLGPAAGIGQDVAEAAAGPIEQGIPPAFPIRPRVPKIRLPIRVLP